MKRAVLIVAAVVTAAGTLGLLAWKAPPVRAPDLPPTFSSWEPPALEVRHAGASAWAIPFPDDARSLAVDPKNELHAKFDLGYPVAMRALELAAEEGSSFKAWVSVLDEKGARELVQVGEGTGARVEMPIPPRLSGRKVAALRISYRPGGPRFETLAVLDPAKIVPELGKAYLANTPPEWGESDDPAHVDRSTLVLLENGKPLGPAHAVHDSIRKLAGGRYSHWTGMIRFSSSDGSDPRANGRTYSVARRVPNEVRLAIYR